MEEVEFEEKLGLLWPPLKNRLLELALEMSANEDALSDGGAVARAANTIIKRLEQSIVTVGSVSRATKKTPKLNPRNVRTNP